MSTPYALADLDELDEAYDDSDEAYEEALPRRGVSRPPVQTAGRQSAYKPRPNNNFVTQAQLEAALGRVSGQIAINSTAVKTLDGRVRGVTSEQARITAAMRKEIADRKKEEESMRKEIQSAREMSVILPMISKNNPMIGLLALGGTSLFGGSGNSTGGDSTSSLLMLALVMSGGKL